MTRVSLSEQPFFFCSGLSLNMMSWYIGRRRQRLYRRSGEKFYLRFFDRQSKRERLTRRNVLKKILRAYHALVFAR